MQRRSHAPGVPFEVDREGDRCRYLVLSILDLARWVTRLDRDCLEKGCGAWTGSARGADARGAEARGAERVEKRRARWRSPRRWRACERGQLGGDTNLATVECVCVLIYCYRV
jgi:hypothetical protein